MSTLCPNSSAEVLFEVLCFLKRSELDYLALTSKFLSQFTTKHFSTFPINSLDNLYIYKNDDSHELRFCSCNSKLSCNCSLAQLQNYNKSGKWIVRFVCVLLRTHPYQDIYEWKKALNSISPLWRGSRCVIHEDRQSVAGLDFHLFPAFYNCALIKFQRFDNYRRGVNLVTFLENIPKRRQNKLRVQIRGMTAWDRLAELIFKAKQVSDS
uniref:F-box domain-containing protein n=1 Tax=Ditylenchus dipsaci TaxID=166011 RepID=A0A915EHB1_9BILA